MKTTTVPPVAAAPGKPAHKKKILVAIHGIGDQVRCETIQSVAAQLCRYSGLPSTIPLGHFNAELVQLEGDPDPAAAYLVHGPDNSPLPAALGFAEVYWAQIPRELAKDRYHLEESKKWARTVVERVRAMDRTRPGPRLASDTQYDLAATVIGEMAEGLKALENMLFLADRANVFKFDLKKVLVEFLGDVQSVAEFRNVRNRIVGLFQKVMVRIHQEHEDAEIYLVAHSEGTVIAFLGILDALHRLPPEPPAGPDPRPINPEWVTQLRGLMTIGSPINKHLLLWEELWAGLTPPATTRLPEPIQWRNYYDFGDPVGFRLDAAREWLRNEEWIAAEGPQRFFVFDQKEHDIGFTRYCFPGKAHTDYWADEAVFGHFIQDVVRPPVLVGHQEKKYRRPRSRLLSRIVSPTLPFFLAFVVLFLGVYLLCKTTHECLQPDRPVPPGILLLDVVGITALLAGVTAAVRIPRLTRSWRWRLGGYLLFAASLGVFTHLIASSPIQNDLLFLPFVESDLVGEGVSRAHEAPPWLLLSQMTAATLVLVCASVAVVVVVTLVSWQWQGLGAKPLVFVGALVVAGVVWLALSGQPQARQDVANVVEAVNAKQPAAVPQDKAQHARAKRIDRATLALLREYRKESGSYADFRAFAADNPELVLKKLEITDDDNTRKIVAKRLKPAQAPLDSDRVVTVKGETQGQIWPVLLAALVFAYLWWIAAILFDLTVVWHHYIRQSGILDRLKTLKQRGQLAA